MNKEEIQKQIESVRGLIEVHDKLLQDVFTSGGNDEWEKTLERMTKHLRTLTATLKPYLNGEKLEM